MRVEVLLQFLKWGRLKQNDSVELIKFSLKMMGG